MKTFVFPGLIKSYGNFSPGYQNIWKNQKKESAKNGTKIGEKSDGEMAKKNRGECEKISKTIGRKEGQKCRQKLRKILHLYYHQKW